MGKLKRLGWKHIEITVSGNKYEFFGAGLGEGILIWYSNRCGANKKALATKGERGDTGRRVAGRRRAVRGGAARRGAARGVAGWGAGLCV